MVKTAMASFGLGSVYLTGFPHAPARKSQEAASRHKLKLGSLAAPLRTRTDAQKKVAAKNLACWRTEASPLLLLLASQQHSLRRPSLIK